MIRYKLSDDPTDALRMAWAAYLGYCADEDQVYGWPDDLDQFSAGWYARDGEVARLREALEAITELPPHGYGIEMCALMQRIAAEVLGTT